jgi:hypothetical protein
MRVSVSSHKHMQFSSVNFQSAVSLWHGLCNSVEIRLSLSNLVEPMRLIKFGLRKGLFLVRILPFSYITVTLPTAVQQLSATRHNRTDKNPQVRVSYQKLISARNLHACW